MGPNQRAALSTPLTLYFQLKLLPVTDADTQGQGGLGAPRTSLGRQQSGCPEDPCCVLEMLRNDLERGGWERQGAGALGE